MMDIRCRKLFLVGNAGKWEKKRWQRLFSRWLLWGLEEAHLIPRCKRSTEGYRPGWPLPMIKWNMQTGSGRFTIWYPTSDCSLLFSCDRPLSVNARNDRGRQYRTGCSYRRVQTSDRPCLRAPSKIVAELEPLRHHPSWGPPRLLKKNPEVAAILDVTDAERFWLIRQLIRSQIAKFQRRNWQSSNKSPNEACNEKRNSRLAVL